MRPNGPAGMVYAYPQSLQNSRQVGPAGWTCGSGREFAVAASEVKALARRTARPTEEIGHRISQVRSATGVSVSAVARIALTITEINAVAGSISMANDEPGAAPMEIARNDRGTTLTLASAIAGTGPHRRHGK